MNDFCQHTVNVIALDLAQSDLIKRLLSYLMIDTIDDSTDGHHTNFHSFNLELLITGLEDILDPDWHQVLSTLTSLLSSRWCALVVAVESTTTLTSV